MPSRSYPIIGPEDDLQAERLKVLRILDTLDPLWAYR